ncbi:hypothetical protein PHSY_006677 [Pseudozyma hubeiensis SY62]|uniref:Uncharacterized protein n=1 Tax=Pseudozyma hubeiensis (strain SY62) TaxID=1305764 RepID=R9PLT2_PSEHS|nr:hypothetical protein PHSY_006677 [Pseudozyma hubeiensis SY62]GAC99080.1 hypothetical protein PHSY_006677 [Pseudozyma hubeiensis SY62]
MRGHSGDRQASQSVGSESYGRRAYDMPPTVAQRPPRPDFVDPIESVQRPRGYPERDSGWGNRRRHGSGRPGSGSHVAPEGADPRRSSGRQYSLKGAPPPPQSPSMRAASPRYSWAPETRQPLGTQDPRRPTASQLDVPRPPSPPAFAVEVPEKERKLEYLLRTIEARLHAARQTPCWQRLDTHLFVQLIEEHKKAGKDSIMVLRTMNSALSHYRLFMQSREGQIDDHVTIDKFETMRHGLQYIVFDICEHNNSYIRKKGHRALLELSRGDMSLVKSNLSALVQILQNDDMDERDLVSELLFSHLELVQTEKPLGTCLADCLQLMFCDHASLRHLVIDFFSSGWGQKAVDLCIGDCILEAALAEHFAAALPHVGDGHIVKLVGLLHDLQSIWISRDDAVSEASMRAARAAATSVLWNLGVALMRRANVYSATDKDLVACVSDDGANILPPMSTDLAVANGLKTFSNLVAVVDRVIRDRDDDLKMAAAQKLSENRIFLNDLEASTAWLFCYLPLDTGEGGTQSVVEHFTPPQKLMLFRSAANLAARVASAAKQSPADLSFPGDKTASEIAQVVAWALGKELPANILAVVEERGCTGGEPAYFILAAEALLTAIHHCESCMSVCKHRPRTISTDDHLRIRVRGLQALAQKIDDEQRGRDELQQAAKVVLALGQEHLRVAWTRNAEQLSPAWLMAPPHMPGWVKPTATAVLTSPKTNSRKDKKRQNDEIEQEDASKDRRARRGEPHASKQEGSTQGQSLAVKHNSSNTVKNEPATSGTQHEETGIAIRGSSKAQSHSPTLRRADCYRPGSTGYQRAEPASPSLLNRMQKRRVSDEWPETSRSRDRPRDVREDSRSRDWYENYDDRWDRRAEYDYGDYGEKRRR